MFFAIVVLLMIQCYKAFKLKCVFLTFCGLFATYLVRISTRKEITPNVTICRPFLIQFKKFKQKWHNEQVAFRCKMIFLLKRQLGGNVGSSVSCFCFFSSFFFCSSLFLYSYKSKRCSIIFHTRSVVIQKRQHLA